MRNLKIIKCVAGAGKTTESFKYLKDHSNGLYLAYTNSVVDDLKYKGILAKTIDSLFLTYIIPKFINVIPIVKENSIIKYIPSDNLNGYQNNILNIRIDKKGKIYNKTKETIFTLNTTYDELKNAKGIPNQKVLLNIFRDNSICIPQQMLNDISRYLIFNYKNEIQYILEKRFSYIIIDEAQDLKDYREDFAQLIYESNIHLMVFGDDNQNIVNFGDWFEKLNANEIRNYSHRTSENICKWIRENLKIDIYGNSSKYCYTQIELENVKKYDNGKRFLLYNSCSSKYKDIIYNWKGPKNTIKTAKGSTIDLDIVIIGTELNTRNLYTAITRTTKNAYSTIKNR